MGSQNAAGFYAAPISQKVEEIQKDLILHKI